MKDLVKVFNFFPKHPNMIWEGIQKQIKLLQMSKVASKEIKDIVPFRENNSQNIPVWKQENSIKGNIVKVDSLRKKKILKNKNLNTQHKISSKNSHRTSSLKRNPILGIGIENKTGRNKHTYQIHKKIQSNLSK